MTLNENDIVLCTVNRIEGTTVFLDIEFNSKIVQGTMIFSEVSPGRIRNIREFVVPNKKIVCKILRIKEGHPELTLRRVTAKERNEVLDRYKKERTLESILKPVLKERTSEILKKIKEKFDLADFLDEAREDPKIISKFISSDKESKELQKILSQSKQDKEKTVQTIIKLISQASTGLSDIKKTLDIKKTNISYLGSSKFSVTVKAKNYKTANSELETIIEKITENAKKHKVKIEVKENKK